MGDHHVYFIVQVDEWNVGDNSYDSPSQEDR